MLWEHRKRAPDRCWGGSGEEETRKWFPKEIVAKLSLVKQESLWEDDGNADPSVCIVILKTRACGPITFGG